MPETASTNPESPSPTESPAARTPESPSRAPTVRESPLQLVLRVLLGFAGLSLVIGFFLPWYRESVTTVQRETASTAVNEVSGLTLAVGDGLAGTPAAMLFLVPALGIALAAVSFVGFRWSAHVAIGVAVTLVGYCAYVLLQMFVASTSYGLWTVTSGTFLILVLGALSWMASRKPAAMTVKRAADDE